MSVATEYKLQRTARGGGAGGVAVDTSCSSLALISAEDATHSFAKVPKQKPGYYYM